MRTFVSPDGSQRRTTGDPSTAVRWLADGWREEETTAAELPQRRSRRPRNQVEEPPATGGEEETSENGHDQPQA